MPTKKKVGYGKITFGEGGIAKKHLEEKFSILPSEGKLKNGHVLHQYLKCNKCCAETERQLVKANFIPAASVQSYNDMRRLLARTLEKFRRLTNPKEFEKFSCICDEEYTVPSTSSNPDPVPDNDKLVPSTSVTAGYAEDPIPGYTYPELQHLVS